MVSTRQKTYDDNNRSVHNDPRPMDPSASHPPRPHGQRASVLVEDVAEPRAIQPVLQPSLDRDEIRRMARLIEEQARVIEELREERRRAKADRRAEAERANQLQPVNPPPPLIRHPVRQPPDVLERHTRPTLVTPPQNRMPEARPALPTGGQVYRNPTMTTERCREAAVNP
jgi:hypothetical protein